MSHVVVVGAGVAGMASAAWLAEAGHRVTLVEKRGRMGGRTMSFQVDGIGLVDNGPHLFSGGYRQILRFLRTIGTDDQVLWDLPPFVIRHPDHGLLALSGGSRGPVALRRARGLLALGGLPLTWRDRVASLRFLAALAAAVARPADRLEEITADEWFRSLGVPPALRDLQLDQLVIGLLNEKPDRVSAYQFVQTLHELGPQRRGVRAADAVWPRVPLEELFCDPTKRYLLARGGHVITGNALTDLRIRDGEVAGVVLADGTELEADAVVLALAPWQLTRLLDTTELGSNDFFSPARAIKSAPIVSVYVWLDRPLGNERLAENLRGCPIEWVFDTSGMHGTVTDAGHCYALAISASHDEIRLTNDELVDAALASLRLHYRAMAEAEVRRTHVIRQPDATFSARPGFERLRLPQRTPLRNLFLAGDWTRTDLPSTMESAAESAARAVRDVVAALDSHAELGTPAREGVATG